MKFDRIFNLPNHVLLKSGGPDVHIDGTDLVGKDTIANAIKTALVPERVSTLTIKETNPYEEMLKNLTPELAPFLTYLVARAIIWDIENVKFYKQTLLVSSHILRAISYLKASKEYYLADLFEELMQYYPCFDATILLCASIDAKRSRITERSDQATELDRKIFTDPTFVEAMDETMRFYAATVFKALVIDTTHLTIEQVTQIALAGIAKNNDTAAPTLLKANGNGHKENGIGTVQNEVGMNGKAENGKRQKRRLSAIDLAYIFAELMKYDKHIIKKTKSAEPKI